MEHRLNGDEPSEMLNKESKRYTIAADDARGCKGSRRCGYAYFGRGFCCCGMANHLTSAAPVDGGKVRQPGREWRHNCRTLGQCHEGIHVFAVYFWNSEGWTVRTEELMKAVLRRVAKTKNLCIKVVTPIWNSMIFSLAIGRKRPKRKWRRYEVRSWRMWTYVEPSAFPHRTIVLIAWGNTNMEVMVMCQIRCACLKAVMLQVTENSIKTELTITQDREAEFDILASVTYMELDSGQRRQVAFDIIRKVPKGTSTRLA